MPSVTASREQKNSAYLCADMRLQDLSESLSFPLYFQIETTSACNARCRMCPRSTTTHERENKFMSSAIRKKLLAEFREHAARIRRVSPFGYGEPLLDKALPAFIAQLKKIGIAEVFISTNASLLDEETAKRLLDSGLDQIDFSVDAFSAELYENVRKGLSRDTVYRNIENFIALRNRAKAHTAIRFRYILQGVNDHEFPMFHTYWGERLSPGDIISRKIQHTFGGIMEPLDSQDYRALMDMNAILPCKALFSSMSILVTGEVCVCNYDFEQQFSLGDIAEKTIEELWQHKFLARRRHAHLRHGRKGFKSCMKCNSWLPEVKLPDIVIA